MKSVTQHKYIHINYFTFQLTEIQSCIFLTCVHAPSRHVYTYTHSLKPQFSNSFQIEKQLAAVLIYLILLEIGNIVFICPSYKNFIDYFEYVFEQHIAYKRNIDISRHSICYVILHYTLFLNVITAAYAYTVISYFTCIFYVLIIIFLYIIYHFYLSP